MVSRDVVFPPPIGTKGHAKLFRCVSQGFGDVLGLFLGVEVLDRGCSRSRRIAQVACLKQALKGEFGATAKLTAPSRNDPSTRGKNVVDITIIMIQSSEGDIDIGQI